MLESKGKKQEVGQLGDVNINKAFVFAGVKGKKNKVYKLNQVFVIKEKKMVEGKGKTYFDINSIENLIDKEIRNSLCAIV